MTITKSMIILGYFEMLEEEQPEETIWGHPEKLEAWFKQVKEKRDEKYGSKKQDPGWEDVDMEQNEETRDLLKQLRKP